MAKRTRISESDDSDRLEGYPHPRETQSLVGHDVALGRAGVGTGTIRSAAGCDTGGGRDCDAAVAPAS